MNQPPPVAAWFQDGFHRFLRPFLKRHFHTVAAERQSLVALREIGDAPLIVFGNHPSWWDPLIAHFLCRRLFSPRQFYAPIDARALAKYQVFKRLGFYGIDLESSRGAAEFLRTSLAILHAPRTSLWLTPEGRFADCRDHDAELMPGLAHLCCKLTEQGVAVPLALEYVYWDERTPECLVRFGPPIYCDQYSNLTKVNWGKLLTEALRENQRQLALLAMQRSPEPFEPLFVGARGAGGMYDLFRRVGSWARGNRFQAQHGDKFN